MTKPFLSAFRIFLTLGVTYFVLAPRDGFSIRSTTSDERTSSTEPVEADTVQNIFQDYIWPTDASRKVTSSFAEYRSTHFHGGIDIGTNGHTGYNVFAVRDGYVSRIRITPSGYGKMLYIKHSDGRTSAYAHLLTFNDTINALARSEQYRRGTYSIDVSLPPLLATVRQGEVVALTGESGFGPPHLHFELRDEHLNPINPMLCSTYIVKDDIAPRIKRVMVSPLNARSMVESSSRPKIMSRFPGRQHRYRIPQSLRVHGLIGFSVDANDKSEGTYSKAGVHSMEFYLDDSLIFAMSLDKVPAEETKEIYLHYDFPTILHGWGKFQKLYIDSGNSLPFYDKRSVGAGVINTDNLSEGQHDYRIVCKDIRENSTEIKGKILANHQPDCSIERVNGQEIRLNGIDLDAIERCYVFGKKNSAAEWDQHTLPRGRFVRDANGIGLPVNIGGYDVIKVIVESKWGSRSNPFVYFNRKPNGPPREVHLATDVFAEYVRCTISSTGMFTAPPIVSLHEGNVERLVSVEALDVYKYAVVCTPSLNIGGRRTIHVSAEINGKPVTAEDSFEAYPVAPACAGVMSSADHRLTFRYDSAAVYRSLYMQISQDEIRNSPVYILEPQDVLLHQGITVTVDASDVARKDYLGLYFRANGGWIFQTSTPDLNGTTFTTTLTQTLGELALLNDGEPPSFGRFRASATRGKAIVAFRYHDNLSGVDTDEIKMYIDEKLVIPEIDGEHNKVWYKGDERLSHGRHTLRVQMKDRMKNESEIRRTITVR